MEVKNLTLSERPMKFSDVIGQDLIMKNLAAQSCNNKFFQSYLLYGHYGCGKTTTARILAAAINCRDKDSNGNPCGVCPHCMAVRNGCVDVVEIDGASNTGVDNVRQLKETAEYLPTVLDKKVYIIDEVHKLSDAAFNALLKVLEEPPEHVVFILATTDRDKIPATVLSRLAKYEFRRIPTKTLVMHMEQVSVRNGYDYTEDGLATIARNADGSVRNAIKMLEIVSEMHGGATNENASLMIGLADPDVIYGMLALLMQGDGLQAFYRAAELVDSGWDPRRLTNEMISICSDAILAKERLDLVDASESYRFYLDSFCQKNDVKRVIVVLDFLMSLSRTLREASGDCSVFKNSILMFLNNSDNRLELLEQQVRELQESLQKMKTMQGSGAEVTRGFNVSEDDQPKTSDSHDEPTDTIAGTESNNTDVSQEVAISGTDEVADAVEVTHDQSSDCSEVAPTSTDEYPYDAFPFFEDMRDPDKIDPFAIFSGFSFSATAEPETIESETADAETGDVANSQTWTERDVETFLSNIEQTDSVLDNLLSLGFIKRTEGELPFFETDEDVFYRMSVALANARGGIPVELRMTK